MGSINSYRAIVICFSIIMLFGISFVSATLTGTETMTRTAPATVNPSSTFSVTYTAVGASGTWGASIQDAVSGGCTFPSGSNSYKTVMLSEDGLTKTITMTAPASGSCTFTGDYQYGTFPIKNFASSSVTIGGTCTPSCTAKTCGDNGCGGSCGTCSGTDTCSNGACVPSTTTCTSGQTQSCTASNTCTGTQTCSNGVWGTCTTSLQKCSDNSCKADCGTTPPTEFCIQVANDWLSSITKSDSCQTNTIVLIVVAFLGVILIGKLAGSK